MKSVSKKSGFLLFLIFVSFFTVVSSVSGQIESSFQDEFNILNITTFSFSDNTDGSASYKSQQIYDAIYDCLAPPFCAGTVVVSNITNGIETTHSSSSTSTDYNFDWMIIDFESFFVGSQVFFQVNYTLSGFFGDRLILTTYRNASNLVNITASTQSVLFTAGNNIDVFNLTTLTGAQIDEIDEVFEIRLRVDHSPGAIHSDTMQIHSLEYNTSTFFITSQCQTDNQQPVFTFANYSSLFLRPFDITLIDVQATDLEGDQVFFANNCDFSQFGVAEGQTVVSETFEKDENITALKERFDVAFLNDSYDSIFTRDTFIGTVWNLSDVDSGVSQLIRNTTNTTTGLNNNTLITSFLVGDDLLPGGQEDGIYLSARDDDAFDIWGFHVGWNDTAMQLHRLKQNDFFELLALSTFDRWRLIVNHDLLNQNYFVQIDEDLDGTIDFTSLTFDVLNNDTNTEYKTFRMFTTGQTVNNNTQFVNLSNVAPTAELWFDTLIIDVINLPPFFEANTNFSGVQGRTFQCSYETLGERQIRTYVTDQCHLNQYNVFINENVLVVDKVFNQTLPNVSLLLPSDTNASIFDPPSASICGRICTFFWFYSFPSKISQTIDASAGSESFEVMQDAVELVAILAVVMGLVLTGSINRTIIIYFVYSLVTFFSGFMRLPLFIFSVFVFSILLTSWFRSVVLGLGGNVSDANMENQGGLF